MDLSPKQTLREHLAIEVLQKEGVSDALEYSLWLVIPKSTNLLLVRDAWQLLKEAWSLLKRSAASLFVKVVIGEKHIS